MIRPRFARTEAARILTRPMKHLLLAHGILGFGASEILPLVVNYFNGVGGHLRRRGHDVIEPQVNPIGSIADRGGRLGAVIMNAPLGTGERLHIIAHSMGGLDARHALAHVPHVKDRVATLVTIGTPHKGSPVADAVAARSGPLFARCPALVLEQLRRNTAALHDLTTSAVAHFNSVTPDVPGVRYMAVAGDAAKSGHELLLFQLAAALGHITNEINDGMVTRTSAHRDGYEPLADWPTDHAGEIGWTLPFVPAFDVPLFSPPHFARYDDIVARL
jgi:triacylglycerol lipase